MKLNEMEPKTVDTLVSMVASIIKHILLEETPDSLLLMQRAAKKKSESTLNIEKNLDGVLYTMMDIWTRISIFKDWPDDESLKERTVVALDTVSDLIDYYRKELTDYEDEVSE